jgi:hypothetical protein
MPHSARAVPWAGLAAGPAAWAASTQLNYALAPWQQAHHVQVTPAIAFGLALASLCGAVWSWIVLRRWSGWAGPEAGGQPRHLLAGIGLGSGILFAVVIFLQGAAPLIIGVSR